MAKSLTISFRDSRHNLAVPTLPIIKTDGAAPPASYLPRLDKNGFLPEGIHDCLIDEIEHQFAATPVRKNLWYKCVEFLSIATASGRFSNAYFAGGFVTNKPLPLDIDLILETAAPYGPAAFKAMEPFFAQGLDTILANYAVHLHFWCEGFPGSIWDCREFFQYFRPYEAFSLGLSPGSRKGIARLRLVAKPTIKITKD